MPPGVGKTDHRQEILARMSDERRSDQEREPGEHAADDDNALILEWSVHLVRRQPERAWVVAATALFAAAAGIFFFKSIVFGAGGLLLILSSTAEFLLPIRHRITNSGVTSRCGLTRFEIAWPAVKRAIPLREGVRLSPLSVASRLDAFRGVPLRFAEDGCPGDRDQVMTIVRTQMERASDKVPQTSPEAAKVAQSA
jgi:hypothetical protein